MKRLERNLRRARVKKKAKNIERKLKFVLIRIYFYFCYLNVSYYDFMVDKKGALFWVWNEGNVLG